MSFFIAPHDNLCCCILLKTCVPCVCSVFGVVCHAFAISRPCVCHAFALVVRYFAVAMACHRFAMDLPFLGPVLAVCLLCFSASCCNALPLSGHAFAMSLSCGCLCLLAFQCFNNGLPLIRHASSNSRQCACRSCLMFSGDFVQRTAVDSRWLCVFLCPVFAMRLLDGFMFLLRFVIDVPCA